MNPFLFLLLAVLTPFGVVLSFLGPIYLSLCVAVYAVYYQVPQLFHKLLDMFYVVQVYTQLYNYWVDHMFQVGFFTYTLPVIFLPFGSIFVALWLTRKFIRKMGDIFQVNVLAG